MLGDGTSRNYFYYVALHFEELCSRGHGLGVSLYCVRTLCSMKSTWQTQAQAEVNGVLPLLELKPGFQPWCQRGSFPPPPALLQAPAACSVYPKPITNIAVQTLLPASSITVIPSQWSLEPGCSALLALSTAARVLSPVSQQQHFTPHCILHAASLQSSRLILSWPF